MSYLLYGNSIADWSIALGITISVALLGYTAVQYFARRLQAAATATHTRIDDLMGAMMGATRWWFLAAVGFAIGNNWLVLSDTESLFVRRGIIMLGIVQAALWGDKAVRRYLRYHMERARQNNIASTTSAAVISFAARALLWVVAVLMVLDNLGFNITTLVASLGIGGVAVALAVQNILGDIFASLSIVLDKPFVVGDFIIVGDALGTVEYIGLKTTRIRSLGGEQIVFSNNELLRSKILNMQRLQDRRQAFVFRISYDCPAARLRLIPAIVREAIEANEKVRFDRAHFRSYGEWGLEFEAVYFVTSPDYNLMMDYQQEINLALHERFEKEGIAFAMPRRLVELAGQERREEVKREVEEDQPQAPARQRFG